jgi:ribokinase
MGNVVVLGSLTLDTIALVDELPQSGAAVIATELLYRFGGKGGNQAVAAAKQGAQVMLIGSVGSDRAGETYLQSLNQQRILTHGIQVQQGQLTGASIICASAHQTSTTAVHLAANNALSIADVAAQKSWLNTSAILLAQLEAPLDAVAAALKLAKPQGVATCLHASPWRTGFPWGEVELDFVIANEHEASSLLGHPVNAQDDSAWINDKIAAMGIHTLIVMRDQQSTLAFSSLGPALEAPAPPKPRDHNIYGCDCFAGVFAARWAETRMLELSLRAASVASSLAVLQLDRQDIMPDRHATDDALGDAISELMRQA